MGVKSWTILVFLPSPPMPPLVPPSPPVRSRAAGCVSESTLVPTVVAVAVANAAFPKEVGAVPGEK